MNSGKLPCPPTAPNLIEVMACEGGCIAGPCAIVNPKQAELQLDKYVKSGAQDSINN